MSLRIQPQATTAFLLVTVLAGCAQIPNAVPVVSLGKSPNTVTRFNIARLYERQKRLGAARKLYAELYTENPQNLDVTHRLAVVSTRLGDFEQANSYYQESLALDPQNADVLADFGYSLHLQGDIEGAEATLRESLDLDPDNKRTIGNLALVVGMNGRLGESLSLYRRIISEAEAQANLGYIHVQRGEGNHAIERYDRALTLDVDLTSAANALVKLAELKEAKSVRINASTSTLLQVAEKPAQNNDQPATSFVDVVRRQTGLATFVQKSGELGRSTIRSPRRVGQVVAADPASSGSEPQTVRNPSVP
jgi:Flp pilus assembly protein TadD